MKLFLISCCWKPSFGTWHKPLLMYLGYAALKSDLAVNVLCDKCKMGRSFAVDSLLSKKTLDKTSLIMKSVPQRRNSYCPSQFLPNALVRDVHRLELVREPCVSHQSCLTLFEGGGAGDLPLGTRIRNAL